MKKNSLIIVIGIFLLIQPLRAQTWEEPKRLTWTSGNSRCSVIAVDSYNHIHVVWQEETAGHFDIYYMKSTDGAVNWTAEKRITWTPGDSEKPDIAIDSNNHIHVVFKGIVSHYEDIFYKKSTNGGTSWTGNRVTWLYMSDWCRLEPAIAADSNNHLHVVFCIYCPGTAGYHDVYYKKSTDGGTHWIKFLRLANTVGYTRHPDMPLIQTTISM